MKVLRILCLGIALTFVVPTWSSYPGAAYVQYLRQVLSPYVQPSFRPTWQSPYSRYAALGLGALGTGALAYYMWLESKKAEELRKKVGEEEFAKRKRKEGKSKRKKELEIQGIKDLRSFRRENNFIYPDRPLYEKVLLEERYELQNKLRKKNLAPELKKLIEETISIMKDQDKRLRNIRDHEEMHVGKRTDLEQTIKDQKTKIADWKKVRDTTEFETLKDLREKIKQEEERTLVTKRKEAMIRSLIKKDDEEKQRKSLATQHFMDPNSSVYRTLLQEELANLKNTIALNAQHQEIITKLTNAINEQIEHLNSMQTIEQEIKDPFANFKPTGETSIDLAKAIKMQLLEQINEWKIIISRTEVETLKPLREQLAQIERGLQEPRSILEEERLELLGFLENLKMKERLSQTQIKSTADARRDVQEMLNQEFGGKVKLTPDDEGTTEEERKELARKLFLEDFGIHLGLQK